MSVTSILDWTQTAPNSVQFGAGGGFVLLARVDGWGFVVLAGMELIDNVADWSGVAGVAPTSSEAFRVAFAFIGRAGYRGGKISEQGVRLGVAGRFYRFTWSGTPNMSWDVTEYTTKDAALGNAPCFEGNVNIYMADGTTKKIKDIKRGDIVLEDIKTGKTNIVARLYSALAIKNDIYFIKKGLIGNNEDITCTNHPIWCNNGKNRVFPEDIEGVEKSKYSIQIYDIQFEDDATFYVNGIKVDSLPPYNKIARLPKNLYYDESKYSEHIYINEDDPIRNKPPMTKKVYNYDS